MDSHSYVIGHKVKVGTTEQIVQNGADSAATSLTVSSRYKADNGTYIQTDASRKILDVTSDITVTDTTTKYLKVTSLADQNTATNFNNQASGSYTWKTVVTGDVEKVGNDLYVKVGGTYSVKITFTLVNVTDATGDTITVSYPGSTGTATFAGTDVAGTTKDVTITSFGADGSIAISSIT